MSEKRPTPHDREPSRTHQNGAGENAKKSRPGAAARENEKAIAEARAAGQPIGKPTPTKVSPG